MERRFQTVKIDEPTAECTVDIIKGLCGKYEEHHKMKIPDSVIEKTVELAQRYIPERYFPDKAIDILDEACACARISNPQAKTDKKYVSQVFNDYISGKISRETYITAITNRNVPKPITLSKKHADAEQV